MHRTSNTPTIGSTKLPRGIQNCQGVCITAKGYTELPRVHRTTKGRIEARGADNNQRRAAFVCWLLACLTSQQHASASKGRIQSDTFMCCHTDIEVADQTFYLIQSQYTDTGPTSPSADPITPGAWQGSHWSANFKVTGMTRPGKIPDLPLSRRTP